MSEAVGRFQLVSEAGGRFELVSEAVGRFELVVTRPSNANEIGNSLLPLKTFITLQC